ncbi:MAG TPA: hypothetical protein VFC48_07795 [Cellulomonas sp.]|nr:hypothetical protein [Cellulomonas sp.]
MSTSDPHIPSGEPDPTIDSTSPLQTTRGAAARAAAAHAAERPAPTPPPGVEAVHADAMPTIVPDPVPEPVHAAPPTHDTAAPGSATPPGAPPASRTDVVPPEPVAPHATGFGGQVWGVVLGVLATPAALVLALVGQGRILAVQSGRQSDPWDASLDVLGIVLVTAAVLVLGVLVYLGLWTAVVPITGGVIATAFGAVFLYAPGIARNETMHWLATDSSRDTVSHATVAGTSGTILLVGFLLLSVGITTAMAKRRGRVLGEFRERGRAA